MTNAPAVSFLSREETAVRSLVSTRNEGEPFGPHLLPWIEHDTLDYHPGLSVITFAGETEVVFSAEIYEQKKSDTQHHRYSYPAVYELSP